MGSWNIKNVLNAGESFPQVQATFTLIKAEISYTLGASIVKTNIAKNVYRSGDKSKKKNQHEPAKLISTPIKQRDIDALKEKYTKGMGIEIRQGDKKLYGRVAGHYKHFMTVQTSHYITSISYVDILIGAVKIK